MREACPLRPCLDRAPDLEFLGPFDALQVDVGKPPEIAGGIFAGGPVLPLLRNLPAFGQYGHHIASGDIGDLEPMRFVHQPLALNTGDVPLADDVLRLNSSRHKQKCGRQYE